MENLCLTEKSRIFIPQPRQAPERYTQTFETRNKLASLYAEKFMQLVVYTYLNLKKQLENNEFEVVKVFEEAYPKNEKKSEIHTLVMAKTK